MTYYKDVQPILQNGCQTCHRPGEVGPFALLTYQDVRKRGKMIQLVTEKRTMPPWHPAPGHGEFRDELRLSDAQIALLKRWVETGMPEGDVKKQPKPPEFPDGWQLGKPDLIVAMEKPQVVPAGGRDLHPAVILPIPIDKAVHLKGLEFRPGNPRVVHHVDIFFDPTGDLRNRGPGGSSTNPGFATERPWLDPLGAELRAGLGVRTVASDLDTDPWTVHVPTTVARKEPRS